MVDVEVAGRVLAAREAAMAAVKAAAAAVLVATAPWAEEGRSHQEAWVEAAVVD